MLEQRQVDPTHPATDRLDEGSLRAKSPTLTHSRPPANSPPAKRPHLGDTVVEIVPTAGLTASPVPLLPVDMASLAGTNWLTDPVIDAYLSLVCHKANGLMGQADIGERGDSPRWYAWTHWFFQPAGDAISWPPTAWPRAKVEEVKHHLFPLHDTSHWMLFLVHKTGGAWTAEFYSSLPGFSTQRSRHWPRIVRKFEEFSQGRVDLSRMEPIEISRPRQQKPRLRPIGACCGSMGDGRLANGYIGRCRLPSSARPHDD